MTSDIFPRDRLATPISVIGIGQTVGSGMALLVGGLLIAHLTAIGPQDFPVVGTLKPWQMTFVIVGLPGCCGRCCCSPRSPNRRAARPRVAPRRASPRP
jgi:MFS family permease